MMYVEEYDADCGINNAMKMTETDNSTKVYPTDSSEMELETPKHSLKQNFEESNVKTTIFPKSMLTFSLIGLTSYLGACVRIGIAYYKIWNIDVNYSIMYTQVVGSLIMGYFVHFKEEMFSRPKMELNKILYIAMTSGLCGSITSFSSWAIESNKNFVLQWDLSWGNNMGSGNGGRFFEWIISMIAGVVIPLSAFRFGRFIAKQLSWSPYVTMFESKRTRLIVEVIILLSFVIGTILVIALPISFSWDFITYTTVFGLAGAYLRYQLSKLNPLFPKFPIGTFVANILGTYLLATIILISKFVVDYYDNDLQSVLFGLCTGFCGCLTTVSTFVAEIDALDDLNSNVYAITTNLVAQIGVILILDIYTFQSVANNNKVKYHKTEQCQVTQSLCSTLMTQIGCSPLDIVNTACESTARCDCGDFVTLDLIKQVTFESQLQGNLSAAMIAVWPRYPHQSSSPTETIDYCWTFQNICTQYMEHIACPKDSQRISTCLGDGIYQDSDSICQCDSIQNVSDHIKGLISKELLRRSHDLKAYQGYLTDRNRTWDYCNAFTTTCGLLLDHLQCDLKSRRIVGCNNSSDYATFAGKCLCDKFSIGKHVTLGIFNAMVTPHLGTLVHRSNETWDVCHSYVSICEYFLNAIDCPMQQRVVSGCQTINITASYPYGHIENWSNRCRCASMEIDQIPTRAIIQTLLMQSINTQVSPVMVSHAPYTLAVSSNPFRQLLYKQN